MKKEKFYIIYGSKINNGTHIVVEDYLKDVVECVSRVESDDDLTFVCVIRGKEMTKTITFMEKD